MSDLHDLPAARPLAASTRAAQRAALENEVASTSADARSSRTMRRWPRTGLAVLGAGALVTATAAGAFVVHRVAEPASDTSTVRCYSVASLGDDSSFKGTEASQVNSGDQTAPPPPPDPVELCGSLWRAGIVRAGADNGQSMDGGVYPVPTLTACTLESGIAAVFPGNETTCEQLGLPRLAS